ncbi:DUF4244 domain-containing protein [Arthrobacter sp. ISL-48]|uniref:DUF4244 domain-containing protein n=1 Tax=Arthrobacter sp. ISL-48 TaxID=2819110 RepID=UPI001BE72201|nr:DUF4244 domain-containing protein [Arthrobacter sp. ISL-48]MBT2532337.1 DUF4244 domain-containing protein [Arthrobacter sp. ISL-48]
MTTNQKGVGAARDSRAVSVAEGEEPFTPLKAEGSADRGNVVELYPGASRPRRRGRTRFMGTEVGMATAEYAIATLAAVGFAGLLVFILRSDEVRGFLLNLIRTALALP